MLPRVPETRVGSLSSWAGLLALTGLQEVGPALAGGDGVPRPKEGRWNQLELLGPVPHPSLVLYQCTAPTACKEARLWERD